MAMIKCKGCGHMISDKAVRCPKCGCPVTKEEPVRREEPQVQPIYYEEDNKANSKKTLYAIMSVLVVVLVGLGLWMWKSGLLGGNGSDNNVSDSSIDDMATKSLDGTHLLRGEVSSYGADMSITINGTDVTGLYHYDFQKAGVNMSLHGTLKDDGTLVMNEHTPQGNNSGRFEGIFDGKEFSGTFYNLTNGNQCPFKFLATNALSTISLTGEAGANEENASVPAGLTFRTFTEDEYDESNDVTYQNRLPNTEIAEKLKGLGFVLSDTKTESRPDYTGEDFYNVTVETYTKTVNGQVTTVKLESDYTEIHFPNLSDVEDFKRTIRACSLKESEDGFEDSEKVYWAGTDVSIRGTIVTLSYRSEA